MSLPLLMIVLVTVGAALMATTTRAWLGYQGVVRQSQARTAREVAEAGSLRIIENLNSNYAHLLVINKDQWGSASSTTGICGNSSSGTPSTTGNIGDGHGRYSLEEYSYSGSPFFGGTATIKVKGELLNTGNTPISTSIIEQAIQISSKTCNSNPGLVAIADIDLDNNDIEGENGNDVGVICLQCHYSTNNNGCVNNDTAPLDYTQTNKECLVGKGSQSTIDGDIFIGNLDLPPVPTPGTGVSQLTPATIDNDTTIKSGSSNSSDLLGGSCINIQERTECLVDDINLSDKKKLRINTSSGTPIRIFVTGNITLSGQSKIVHVTSSSKAASVGLFGNKANSDDNDDQVISISGRSKITKAWVYFPDANVGINGGSGGTDIYGSVWAKSWGGSGSNNANIVVPTGMADDIENLYDGMSIGPTTFRAMGSSKWRNLISE